MAPHQERVVAEKRELDEKIGKLNAFFITETFFGLDAGEKRRLYIQLHVMEQYSAVLADRIAHFK